MKKKLISILLAGCMVISLAACGDNSGNSDSGSGSGTGGGNYRRKHH